MEGQQAEADLNRDSPRLARKRRAHPRTTGRKNIRDKAEEKLVHTSSSGKYNLQVQRSATWYGQKAGFSPARAKSSGCHLAS